MAIKPGGYNMKPTNEQPQVTTNQAKPQSMNIGMMIIIVVIGLAIGFGIAKATNKKTTTASANTSASVTPSAEKLDNTLVTLGVDHMTLTDQAVDAALDGSPNANATATALYANGNDIGAAVGSVYGKSAETTFDSVWKLHLDQFVNYAVADKEGNAAAKQTALNTIQTGYTVPLAQFLAKANPNLPENVVQSDLTDHVAMTAMMIDDHVQGNYTAEQSELNMANTHITGIFSTLAGAIVKQYPSKFVN
jgi:hypothetical protein